MQLTLTIEGLSDVPSSEDFVTCNRLRPPGVSMNCPSSEDFVSCNGLRPLRASIICPSSEVFVSYNGLRPRGASRSAPLRRTLSRETDFGPWNGPTTTKRANRSKNHKPKDRTNERKMPGEIYLAMVEDFALDAWSMLRWSLRALGVVEWLDEKVVSKDQ